MKEKANSKAQDERKPMPVRLMSSVHLINLEAGRLCGCPVCLEEAGLELVEVYDRSMDKYRRMLVNWFSKTHGRLERTKRVRRVNPETPPLAFPSQQSHSQAEVSSPTTEHRRTSRQPVARGSVSSRAVAE